MDLARSTSSERGFSLVETIISIGLLTAVALGAAQLLAVASAVNLGAKDGTSTALLTTQKMEQLRALTWRFGDETTGGLPVSDNTTNLAMDPAGSDGQGLNPSPAESITQSTPGYVDHLDREGKWVGTGTNPPSGTRFVRRWSIRPLPTDPGNTLVLQVSVVPLSREARSSGPNPGNRLQDETRLVSVMTRKAP